jgi:hypothetical protein
LPGGRLEADEGPQERVAREILDELGPRVEVEPLLDVRVHEPFPDVATWCWTAGSLRGRLAGWRMALNIRLWDFSGWTRWVRAVFPRGTRGWRGPGPGWTEQAVLSSDDA